MATPLLEIPTRFTHAGLILARNGEGPGSSVVGDPCIVRDETVGGYRMFLFWDPPGHGQAVCRSLTDVGVGKWEMAGPLVFTNPQAVWRGMTHKPFVVQEARRPNVAAKIGGKYHLVSVGFTEDKRKYVHRAWAHALSGPWTWESEPLILPGGVGAFDEKHVDAVTGYYFPELAKVLYFYMGYPKRGQVRNVSAFGSGQGVAMQDVTQDGEMKGAAVKLGEYLAPMQKPGHWASGWIGGLQLLPGKEHRWIGLVNASPTAPDPGIKEIWNEEPAPSLGGFAWCDEEFPVKNWVFADEPLEWIEQLPAEAVANGEGTNLWRHHLLLLGDGRCAIFYNSGFYGREQMYMKISTPVRMEGSGPVS